MLKKNISLLIIIFLLQCFPPFVPKKKKPDYTALALVALASQNQGSCSGFFVRSFFTDESECRTFNKVGNGTNVEIFEQAGINMQSQFSSSNFSYAKVASEFDTIIYPKLLAAIGTPTDIDNNKKITILVYNIGFGIGGYVDPINFLADDPSDPTGRSNQKEILYIDASTLLEIRRKNLSANLPDPFLSTIAHEFQHLIRFRYELGFSTVIRTFNDITNKSFIFDDTWINEGTSEVASDIAGYGPQYSRMSCFRGDPTSGCTNGSTGISMFTWRGSIRNYSSAYTFLNYLYSVAGLTETDRNTFLKATTQGSVGNRGSSITSLMSLFQTTAPRFNSTILGTDTTGMFKRMYASFLSQAFNPARYPAATTTLFLGSTNLGNMTNLYTTYPLPVSLNPIYTFSSAFGIVKGSNFVLEPSMFYRVSENSAVAPSQEDAVKIWNQNNVTFGPEFIIFNGKLDTNSILTSGNLLSRSTQIQMDEDSCPRSYAKKYYQKNPIRNALRENLTFTICDKIE
jgi:hypothetical protein